jgi:hypothetical protein
LVNIVHVPAVAARPSARAAQLLDPGRHSTSPRRESVRLCGVADGDRITTMSSIVPGLIVVYAAIGMLATYLSFQIELKVLKDITKDSEFAWIGAIVFEGGKVLTILMYRYSVRLDAGIPIVVRFLTRALQVGLFAFALFCSLSFFAKYLAAPNLSVVREAEQALVERTYADLITAQVTRADAEIAELQSQLTAEMNNVIGGEFVGSRYRDFERRLSNARRDRQNELDRLQRERRAQLKEVAANEFEQDPRVRNITIHSLVTTLFNVFRVTLPYSALILFFSALTSLLIEMTIYVTFEHVMVSGLNLETARLRQEARTLFKQIKLQEEVNARRTTLETLRVAGRTGIDFIKNFGRSVGRRSRDVEPS